MVDPAKLDQLLGNLRRYREVLGALGEVPARPRVSPTGLAELERFARAVTGAS